jgi:hypothetical protein
MRGSGGGGYGSRQITERPVKTGTGSHATTPGYAGQLGNKQGDHITRRGGSGYRGEPMHVGRSFQPAKFGNEIAANTVCGVGGSRTVYSSGSQSGSSGHGPANPGNPAPRQPDILNQYGPDYRRPHNPGRGGRSDSDADF